MPYFLRKLLINPVEAYAVFIIVFVSFFILAYLAVGFVWPLYLLAMGAGFFISVFYPKSGMLSVIFLTMIFERFFTLQSLFIGKEEYKIYPLDIVLIGVIAGLLFQRFKKKFSISLLCARKEYYILAVFIILNVVYFAVSVEVLGADYAISFSTLKNYAFYSLLYFIMIALVKEKKDVEEIARFFFAGAVGIIIFIFIGLINGQGLWSEYTPLSTSGVRTLAFPHGLYLSLIFIPALLYLALFKSRWPWLALAGVWMAGIAGTMMRHLWIALAVSGIAVYLFMTGQQKMMVNRIVGKFFLAGVAAGVAVFYIMALFPQSNINNLGQDATRAFSERIVTITYLEKDESYAWRSVVWHSAYKLYKRNPLFGIGTGQKVSVELENYRDFVEVKNLHNSYLTILIQFGIAGLAVFLYFIWTSIAYLVRSFGNNSRGWYQLSILGILGVYLAAFVFQPYLETNLLSVFFWMSLGIGQALTKDL